MFYSDIQAQENRFEDPNFDLEDDLERRMERMNELLDKVVVIDRQDLDYYNRYKKKTIPPKIEIHQRKRGPKPKNSIDEAMVEEGHDSFADLSMLEQGMAMKSGVNMADVDPKIVLFDRRLGEFEEELSKIESPVSGFLGLRGLDFWCFKVPLE